MPFARFIIVTMLVMPLVAIAQTAQPATQPTAEAATQPSTQPAAGEFDRSTPVGACQYFDKHIADIGIEGGMQFYHCATNAQRRYARAELEWYVSLNKLMRTVRAKFDADVAKEARTSLGDVDDYSQTKVDVEGDAAAIQHPDSDPYPLIRIDGRWRFSMVDLFEMKEADELMGLRLYMEEKADKMDALHEKLKAGAITTADALTDAIEEMDE